MKSFAPLSLLSHSLLSLTPFSHARTCSRTLALDLSHILYRSPPRTCTILPVVERPPVTVGEATSYDATTCNSMGLGDYHFRNDDVGRCLAQTQLPPGQCRRTEVCSLLLVINKLFSAILGVFFFLGGGGGGQACYFIFDSERRFSVSRFSADPLQWNENQVYCWADWFAQEYNCHMVDIQAFRTLNGQQLCSLSPDQLAGFCLIREQGMYLYGFLEQIKSAAATG